MQKFVEEAQIVSALVPVDLSGAANAGDWVCMKGYGRCVIIFHGGIGTAGDDPIFVLEQATAVAGTGHKALLFTEVWKKQGALLTAVGTFTKVTQTAATSYTDATSAEVQKLYVFEVDAEQLDVDNGFDCIQLSIADVGMNAALASALYILLDPRYPQETPESAIVD